MESINLCTFPFLRFDRYVTHLQSSWRTAQLSAVEAIEGGEVEPDDDASLYRLFGVSLFAGMRFRKKVRT